MDIKEFREKYEINAEKAVEDLLEIKEYLPVAEKYLLATTVADACFDVDENGVYSMDTFKLHMAFITKIIEEYTNLVIDPEETFEAYDWLTTTGVMGKILEEIEAEYSAVQSMMNGYIQDKMSYENSTAKILSTGITALLSSIEETSGGLLDMVGNAVQGFDAKSLEGIIKRIK